MEEGDKYLCPCCKACKNCTMFQKILDLQDKGLVIYRHPKRVDDQATSLGDVFILHNTKDTEIKTSDFLNEIEECKVSCPRCRHIMRHAKTLLRNVPTIEKKNIVGICDHCRKRAESRRIPCYSCDIIVKKFIDRLGNFIKTHRSKFERTSQPETRGLTTTKRIVGLYASHEDLSWLKKSRMPKKRDLELERILQSERGKPNYAEDILVPSLQSDQKDVAWLKKAELNKENTSNRGSKDLQFSKIIQEPEHYVEDISESSLQAVQKDVAWLRKPEVQKNKENKDARGSKDLQFSKVIQDPEHYFRHSVSKETILQKSISLYTSKKSPLLTKPILLKRHDKHHGEDIISVKKYATPIHVESKKLFKFQGSIIEDIHQKYFKYVFPQEQKEKKKNTLSHKSSANLIKKNP